MCMWKRKKDTQNWEYMYDQQNSQLKFIGSMDASKPRRIMKRSKKINTREKWDCCTRCECQYYSNTVQETRIWSLSLNFGHLSFFFSQAHSIITLETQEISLFPYLRINFKTRLQYATSKSLFFDSLTKFASFSYNLFIFYHKRLSNCSNKHSDP